MIFSAVPDLLVVGGVCFAMAGQDIVGSIGRRGADVETRNFNRATVSVGGLAVAAFMMHTAANDLGGYGGLGRFVVNLPYRHQPFQVWLTLGLWALLLARCALLFCVAMNVPAGRRSAENFAMSLFTLALCIGLWLWAGFIPQLGGVFAPWIDALNFGISAFYVFGIADGIAGLLFSMRRAPVQRLPSPGELGMPVAGPASRVEAHNALRG